MYAVLRNPNPKWGNPKAHLWNEETRQTACCMPAPPSVWEFCMEAGELDVCAKCHAAGQPVQRQSQSPQPQAGGGGHYTFSDEYPWARPARAGRVPVSEEQRENWRMAHEHWARTGKARKQDRDESKLPETFAP